MPTKNKSVLRKAPVRGSERWSVIPGNFDPLHRADVFPSTGGWELPDLLPQQKNMTIPSDLYPHVYKKRNPRFPALLHFYLEDYHFELLWNNPQRGLKTVTRPDYWGVCTPDFSLGLDMPLVMQMWQIYRCRWVGRYWQEHGVNVIPAMVWLDERSFDFVFEGVPEGQIVAHGVPNLKDPLYLETFLDGYREMVRKVKPRAAFAFTTGAGFSRDLWEVETVCFMRYHFDRRRKGNKPGGSYA